MTEEEKQIWNTTYGASFSIIVDSKRLGDAIGKEVALHRKREAVEEAIQSANAAVLFLRDWRRDQDPKAGIEIE